MYTLKDWHDAPFFSFYFIWKEKKHLIHNYAMGVSSRLIEDQDAHGFYIEEDEGEYSLVLSLNMSDTFAYACADSEELGPHQCIELILLKQIFNEDSLTAVRYAAELRGQKPISRIAQRERYQEIDKEFELAYGYVKWLMAEYQRKRPLDKQEPYTLEEYLSINERLGKS